MVIGQHVDSREPLHLGVYVTAAFKEKVAPFPKKNKKKWHRWVTWSHPRETTAVALLYAFN